MVETMVRSGQLLDQSGLAGDGSLNVAVKMPGALLIYIYMYIYIHTYLYVYVCVYIYIFIYERNANYIF